MNDKSGKGRVALVTGSAGGIMRGVCVSLARRGYAIATHYRPERGNADETCTAIRETGAPCAAFGADVSSENGAAWLVSSTREKFGRLDVLVCGVGPMLVKDLFDTTAEEFAIVVRDNLTTTFSCIKAVLPLMRDQSFGRIIAFGMTGSE